MRQYTCGMCGFQVRSEDDDEIVEMVQEHAHDHHDMELAPADIKQGMEEA